MMDVASNQSLILDENDAHLAPEMYRKQPVDIKAVFQEVTEDIDIIFSHVENDYVDFNRDRLLYHMQSNEGPKLSIADVNSDGLIDFYVGGAKDSPGKLFVQYSHGKYKCTNEEVFQADAGSEDSSSIFFDADQDNDMDLYVASGGTEFSVNSFALMDRLYLNDGKGNFTKSQQLLPAGMPESSSVVCASDFDQDGDQDLFVGIRLRPGLIGVPQNGYLLLNDGNGNFSNGTEIIAPGLTELGMITDALWVDYDNDKDNDLVVVGEWMAIKVFRNTDGKLVEVGATIGLGDTAGWWNAIEAADIDNNGQKDLIVGNHGLNSRFHASKEEPVSCYINDFDQNGRAEQITCMYNQGKSYPQPLRHDLVMQLPDLKKKYLKYESYKNQTIHDIFPEEVLQNSIVHEVTQLQSVILNNKGDGTFEVKPLPLEAQLSPVYAILVEDFDRDGRKEIFLGGNLHKVKPEVGRYDANFGVLLKGTDDSGFKAIPIQESGLVLDGEIRDVKTFHERDKHTMIIARNNAPLQFFEF